MRTIALLILTLLLPTAILYAQPSDLGYDPPPGWEFIKQFDAYNFALYVHNDILLTEELRDGNNIAVHKYSRSSDGGKTWDSIGFPYTKYQYVNQIKGTPIIYKMTGDTIPRLTLSTDMGLSWDSSLSLPSLIDPDSKWDIDRDSYGDILISSPHHPETEWYVKYSHPTPRLDPHFDGNGHAEKIFVTKDAGHTWSLLYQNNGGPSLSIGCTLRFDYRDPSVLYLRVTSQFYTFFSGSSDTVYNFVFHDQSRYYTPFVGDLVGVKEKGQHWYWSGKDRSNSANPTAYITVDSNGKNDTTELLKQLMPQKFPLDTAHVYDHPISFYPTFYPPDPLQSLYTVRESQMSHDKDTVYFDSSWVFFSKDLVNFQPLWRTGSRARAGVSNVDVPTGNVYLITIDTERFSINYNPYSPRSIWKRKVFSPTLTTVHQISASDNYAVINITANGNELIYNTLSTSSARISVCDVLGREVKEIYSGILSSGEHRFPIELPNISSGIYFLHISQQGYSKILKFVK